MPRRRKTRNANPDRKELEAMRDTLMQQLEPRRTGPYTWQPNQKLRAALLRCIERKIITR